MYYKVFDKRYQTASPEWMYTWILGMCKHLTHRHKLLVLSHSHLLETVIELFQWCAIFLRIGGKGRNWVVKMVCAVFKESMWRLVIKQCWYHCQLSNSFSARYNFRFYEIMVFTLAPNEPIWLIHTHICLNSANNLSISFEEIILLIL